MPDLSHLWQRFLIASALIFGLALGVAATVFGYSNTAPVNVAWSVFHLNGIPLWTVALVPLVLFLVVGTLYHWWNNLHHFTQHMRHRHRVHELEAEVTSLRAQLDQLLEMPGHPATAAADKSAPTAASSDEPAMEPASLPEGPASNGDDKASRKSRKRVSLSVTDTEPVAVATTNESTSETEPREESTSEA